MKKTLKTNAFEMYKNIKNKNERAYETL